MVVNERHGFRGTFLMYGMIMIEMPTLILILVFWKSGHLGEEGALIFGIVAFTMLAAFFLIMSIRLELRIDDEGLSFRNPPFMNRWKKFPKETIQKIEVKKMDGIFKYGGLGVRFGKKHRAYIYMTDHVIELIPTGNKKYIFSTQKPVDVKKMLGLWNQEESFKEK